VRSESGQLFRSEGKVLSISIVAQCTRYSMDDKYFWTVESKVGVEDFVKKVCERALSDTVTDYQFRPSIIDDRDTPVI
jgi:hypothetical protein